MTKFNGPKIAATAGIGAVAGAACGVGISKSGNKVEKAIIFAGIGAAIFGLIEYLLEQQNDNKQESSDYSRSLECIGEGTFGNATSAFGCASGNLLSCADFAVHGFQDTRTCMGHHYDYHNDFHHSFS